MESKRLRPFSLFLLIAVFLPSGLFARNDRNTNAGEKSNDIRSIDKMITIINADTLAPEEKFAIAYQVMKRSIEISYTEGKAESYLNIGIYFIGKRKHAAAISFILTASQLFSLLRDTIGLMRADHSLFAVEFYLKNYESAISSCRHGLELARHKKDYVYTGIFLNNMADVFHEQMDTSKALDYYMEALKYFTKARDRKKLLGVYISIGGIYLDEKRYQDVIRMYDTLALIADSVNPGIAGTMYTRMAHVYDMQHNLPRAVYFNRKALSWRRKAKLMDAENSSLINLAGDFLRMNQADSGLFYMSIALEKAEKHKKFYLLKSGYSILYDYYLKKGNKEKALDNFLLMASANDSILSERLNTDIVAIKEGQNISALKQSISVLERQNYLQKRFIRNQQIFKFLLIAIVFAVLLAVIIIVRINIRHLRSKKKIGTLNIKFQHEAAERKLIQKRIVEKEDQYKFIAEHSLDLITRIDKDYNFTYASQAATDIFGYSPKELSSINLFELVISGYSDFLKEQLMQIVTARRSDTITFLARKKRNEPLWVESSLNPVFDPKTGDFREFVSVTRNIQELKKREMGIVEGTKQKENLLREIHHRVKNNFAILVSLINMQKAQSQNEDIRQSLTDLQLRIRTMALVHEMLYRSEDFEKISFPDYVRSIASVVSSTYGRMNVHLDFEMEPLIINIETAIPLGLMLNELLSNAYRHAFSDNTKGSITVSFKKEKAPNFYALTISDTGIGLPQGFSMEGNKTMGLQIVEILVKQIEARLHIEQTNGTSFTISFPIEA